jgi:hypothetical protein
MPKVRNPSQDEVRAFFSWSELLDREVLRPLSHIRPNWEASWSHSEQRYEPEENSFADELNIAIELIATTLPPERYHDNEDVLAQYVIEKLKWPIRKEGKRWVGEDYASILEQGGFEDVDQGELLTAATGRVFAAFRNGQEHYYEMEKGHRQMLAAILSIIIYHRFG